MKKILYIEYCDFNSYPLGGHLSFAKHLATAMAGDIDIAGISTESDSNVGKWGKKMICGYEYNFYTMGYVPVSFKKPIVPARISSYFAVRKHFPFITEKKKYEIIIIQTPETLMAIPQRYLKDCVMIMPGIENVFKFSRYKIVHAFAALYDKLLFWKLRYVKMILPAADGQAISEFIERGKGAICKNQVVQFPTRYDADVFKVKDKKRCRAELKMDPKDIIIVTTGRINWLKGWKFMVDAFEYFQKEQVNAKLYFLGKGEDENQLKAYITVKGLDSKVILAGVQPMEIVSDYLNAADLYIMGSYFEGWSTSLVEAIACAKPCVVTNFSSAHDLVKNYENGFVQDDRDEEGFARLMADALSIEQCKIDQHACNAYKMSVQTMRSQLNEILKFV